MSQSINDRLSELTELEDGWLDGEYGKKVPKSVINAVSKFVNHNVFNDSRPGLFPVEEGGISIEKDYDNYYLQVEYLSGTVSVFIMDRNVPSYSFWDIPIDSVTEDIDNWMHELFNTINTHSIFGTDFVNEFKVN